jgi:hypothetical protein
MALLAEEKVGEKKHVSDRVNLIYDVAVLCL